MLLLEQVRHWAAAAPERPLLIDAGQRISWARAPGLIETTAVQLGADPRPNVYFQAPDSALLALALCAADLAGKTACVLSRQFTPAELAETVDRLGADGRLFADDPASLQPLPGLTIQPIAALAAEPPVSPPPAHPAAGDGQIIILTSGTTGRPKAARYTWRRLLAQIHPASDQPPLTWLLAYPLNHFAGIQMLLHCLVNGQTLVIPPARDFEAVLDAIHRHNVDAISATPTFWRLLAGRLGSTGRPGPSLRQITLGGEATTPEILARLRDQFPAASISQVYATTELGSCFAVTDGRPGFPAEYLARAVGNVRLQIVDGELYVCAGQPMLGYVADEPLAAAGEWTATGDLVELAGDRVLFRGRRGETINVGGVKVHPAAVEAVILEVEGVQAVRVYGRSNPVTGQLVVAELELAPGADREAVRRAIQAHCRRQLNRYEQPRQLFFSRELARRNEKLARGATFSSQEEQR